MTWLTSFQFRNQTGSNTSLGTPLRSEWLHCGSRTSPKWGLELHPITSLWFVKLRSAMHWMNATSSVLVQTALAEDSRTGSSPVTWGRLLQVCIIVVVKRTTLVSVIGWWLMWLDVTWSYCIQKLRSPWWSMIYYGWPDGQPTLWVGSHKS